MKLNGPNDSGSLVTVKVSPHERRAVQVVGKIWAVIADRPERMKLLGSSSGHPASNIGRLEGWIFYVKDRRVYDSLLDKKFDLDEVVKELGTDVIRQVDVTQTILKVWSRGLRLMLTRRECLRFPSWSGLIFRTTRSRGQALRAAMRYLP